MATHRFTAYVLHLAEIGVPQNGVATSVVTKVDTNMLASKTKNGVPKLAGAHTHTPATNTPCKFQHRVWPIIEYGAWVGR